MRILNVVGARPNFMKIAPLAAELSRRGIEQVIVHTGQHYDESMSQVFFQDLGIPQPDIDLGVGSASHAVQTGEVMIRFDEEVHNIKPDCIVVVGDVNSTLACALVGSKLRIPVAHVEAGLRSFDRRMPEEINRIVTDHISDLLFTPSADADENLRVEGIPFERVHRVGNIMIDSLLKHREIAEGRHEILDEHGLKSKQYALVTMHRPENVDISERFEQFAQIFSDLAGQIPLAFPMHPRTRFRAEDLGILSRLEQTIGMHILEPLGYLDFMSLILNSRFVMTDSGGLQEETTVFDIPCLTLRPNTERPVTVTVGTNTIVDADRYKIMEEVEHILGGGGKQGSIPPLWDGQAASRIVDVLQSQFY